VEAVLGAAGGDGAAEDPARPTLADSHYPRRGLHRQVRHQDGHDQRAGQRLGWERRRTSLGQGIDLA
jgi:hypothetical protein